MYSIKAEYDTIVHCELTQ